MVYEFDNYRSYLRSVLAARIQANPRYSLRAMARNLEMAPSHLSGVLSGRKNLSPTSTVRVTRSLRLESREAEYFQLLVQYEGSKDLEVRATIQEKLNRLRPARSLQDLELDSFRLISDWYHIPVLEMAELTNFSYTPEAISRRLGITVHEARAAIERLERLGLLRKDGDKYVKTHSRARFESPSPDSQVRRFHKQMLRRAEEALATQTPKDKVVTSSTLAIHPKDLPRAKALVDEFLDKLSELMENVEEKTDVYHLTVHFFNLTRVR